MKTLMLILLCLVLPGSAVLLQYCDDNPADRHYDEWSWVGQRITPPAASGKIVSIWAYIYGTVASYPGYPVRPFYVHLAIATCHPTQPQQLLWSSNMPFYTAFTGWRQFPVNYHWNGNGESDFMVAGQAYDEVWGIEGDSILNYYYDAAVLPPNRNFLSTGGTYWEESTVAGDFLFKVEFVDDTAVAPASVGQIKASFVR